MLVMSIIIPTYNREDSLPKVLSALLLQQKALQNIEVIIVDDGSTDKTASIVEGYKDKFSFNFRYLYQSNSGAPTARNLGIREARGRIVLFLDSDIIPSEELIPAHLRFHEEYQLDNFALRGVTKFCSGDSNSVRFTEISEVQNDDHSVVAEEYTELCWADFVSSNISLKKSFLIQKGLFDKELSAYQDVELGYRLGKENLKLYNSNKALGHHYHPVNLDQYLKYAEKYGKSLAIWYSKSPNLVRDLIQIKREDYYGFYSLIRPKSFFKYFIKLLLVNRMTVGLFISIGKKLEKKNDRKFIFYYRQAFQYYRRKYFLMGISSRNKNACI